MSAALDDAIHATAVKWQVPCAEVRAIVAELGTKFDVHRPEDVIECLANLDIVPKRRPR